MRLMKTSRCIRYVVTLAVLIILMDGGLVAAEKTNQIMQSTTPMSFDRGKIASKPLFRDPVHDGAADPVLCWNRAEGKWFMFYTNRRANVSETTGVEWVHGTEIGIAESSDGGANWKYRGTANIKYGQGEYSYWAPEVIEHDGTYHMYLTFVPGIFTNWSHPRDIIHLTSKDLLNWKYESTLKLSSNKVIDACVFRLPNGTWRMWYNNEVDSKSIYYADSPDLYNWQDRGKAMGERPGEGPKVFRWKNRYWMIVDVWQGLGVYYSDDCVNWTRQDENLLEEPGKGPDDKVKGDHPDVVVSGDRAYLFYFTHPGRRGDSPRNNPYEQRRSSIQVVELSYMNGKISCDRDKTTYIQLLGIELSSQAGRKVSNFNRDWKFAKSEMDGAEKPGFDDSRWETVRLPHDWAISGPFNPNENGYAGKLPWRGTGWYRKTFTLDNHDNNKRVYFDFDGVMAFPKVYINGKLAGQWDYGYMSFRVDATKYVNFGGSNVIAVYVDTRRHGTRWYPGAGIYRKVMMTVCEQVHIAHWGTYVTTPEINDSAATVRVQSKIENHLDNESEIDVKVMLYNPDGRKIATVKQVNSMPAHGTRELLQTFVVGSPQLWDITSPKLYKVETIVSADNKIIDSKNTAFGIRTFRFTADDGFFLNGRRVQLYGVNLHHDHGPLGAAFYTRAMERQLEIMRDMGVNAIRTSHNPPAPELLDLCDRMGFVVWDEAFDKWDDKADRVRGEPPLKEHGEKQIRNLVLRDRNHPCVVIWSIGNEIGNRPYDREGKSPERVKYMGDFVRKYDPTRPVGISCHIPGTADEPILDSLDLTGWNYARRYSRYRQRYPDKPIIYSESASALSTRGFYELPFPNEKTQFSRQLQVSSYDLNSAAWSDIADVEFKLMEDDSFVAGEFVWTGFDYLGEPTPFSRQARSSYFGIVDLCGIPKDRFYLYRSYWRPDVTTVHILPHWNWPDHIGKNVPVFVYTNGDSAELMLNGKSLGKQTKGKVPKRPPNFALAKAAFASSVETNKGNVTANANDANNSTRWSATSSDPNQWWQVDLGEVMSVGYLAIEFEREAKNYGYHIKASTDGEGWTTIVTKNTSRIPRWGGPRNISHEVDTQARFLRIEFTALRAGTWASIRELGAYPEKVESAYYDVTYKYRLRWNDVIYEPGELKAIAYKDGEKIGQTIMRTAGKPAGLRLIPDRKELAATGEDLCYILVEAHDKKGTLCPLADNLVNFEIDGPAEIVAVGNGNPLSLEPFQADYRKLFYGKAMLIVRTKEGQDGRIQISAKSAGLRGANIVIRSSK